jgi:hypothetical protein
MSIRLSSQPFLNPRVKTPSFENLLFVSAELCTRDADELLQTYPEDLAASLFMDILHIVDKYKQVFKKTRDDETCPRCGYPRVEEIE